MDIANENLTLWRYMDVPGLLWMLQNRLLFFSFPETFDDPYEGEFARPFVEKMKSLEGEHSDHNRKFFETMRLFNCTVSCWHQHEHENAMMWRSYAGNVGVAVRTSVGMLKNALPNQVVMKSVDYVDFDTVELEYGNLLDRLSYKRLEFFFEREVRAIAWVDRLIGEQVNVFDFRPNGVGIEVDPSAFITEVRVGPQLCPWFAETLAAIIKSLGFEIPVIPSRFREEPNRLYKHTKITALTPWSEVESTSIPPIFFTRPNHLIQETGEQNPE